MGDLDVRGDMLLFDGEPVARCIEGVPPSIRAKFQWRLGAPGLTDDPPRSFIARGCEVYGPDDELTCTAADGNTARDIARALNIVWSAEP